MWPYLETGLLRVKVDQSCPTLCDLMGHIVHGILQARILEWVAFPFSRGSSQPRDQIQVFCIAGRFFTSWATGKPKNSGVGSLSLLQRIFPTQKSNQGLLHCGHILYQLSYQGSPPIIPTSWYPHHCVSPSRIKQRWYVFTSRLLWKWQCLTCEATFGFALSWHALGEASSHVMRMFNYHQGEEWRSIINTHT